jgi:hypothetical protein
MTHDPLSQTAPHLGHRLLVAAALLLASAVATTWAWNSSLLHLFDTDRLGFVDGLAISIAVVFLGALFGAARGLTCFLDPDRSSLRQ